MEIYLAVDATSSHFKSRWLTLSADKLHLHADGCTHVIECAACSQLTAQTSENHPQTLVYLSVCAAQSNEPLQRSRGRLMQSLAAVVEEHSISLPPSLHPSVPPFLPSLPLPPDSNDAGGKLWSGPRVSHPPPERDVEGGRRGKRIPIQRGKGAAVSAERWE